MPILHRITTDRLVIEECYDVIPEHVEWLNDKDLMRWSEQRWKEHTRHTQALFLAAAKRDGNPMVFNITLRGIVGYEGAGPVALLPVTIGSLHARIDKRHKRADLGIMLGPKFHGQRFAREAWLAVERLLVDVKGIRKFEGGCASGNEAMMGLFWSMGYGLEGTRRRHFDIDNVGYDLNLYGKVVE